MQISNFLRTSSLSVESGNEAIISLFLSYLGRTESLIEEVCACDFKAPFCLLYFQLGRKDVDPPAVPLLRQADRDVYLQSSSAIFKRDIGDRAVLSSPYAGFPFKARDIGRTLETCSILQLTSGLAAVTGEEDGVINMWDRTESIL